MRVADPVLDIPHYLYDGGEQRHPHQDVDGAQQHVGGLLCN